MWNSVKMIRLCSIPAAALGSLVLLALAAACGGDSDSGPNEAASPTSTSPGSETPSTPLPSPIAASPTPTSPASETSSTPLPSPVAALRDELMPKLLSEDDLPDGWTLLSTDEHPHRGSVFCDTPFEPGTAPLFRLTRVFQKGETGPVLSQRISAYPEGGAEAVMRAFREATADCDEWTKITETGSQTWKLLPLEIQSFGDDMIALDLPSTVGALTIDNHFVMLREGDVIAILGYGGPFLDRIDPSETEDFVRRAASKLAQDG